MHTTTLASASRSSSLLRTAGFVLAGSLLLALSSHVAVPLPWTPVPMTLQTFAVVLLAMTIGPSAAAMASVAYLIEGALGAPVFAPGGVGGVVQLFGLTGGFLLSYPLASLVSGWIASHKRTSFSLAALAAAAGIAVMLASGAAWFAAWSHLSARAVLMVTVFPFLAGETVKIFAAAGIATALQRNRR